MSSEWRSEAAGLEWLIVPSQVTDPSKRIEGVGRLREQSVMGVSR